MGLYLAVPPRSLEPEDELHDGPSPHLNPQDAGASPVTPATRHLLYPSLPVCNGLRPFLGAPFPPPGPRPLRVKDGSLGRVTSTFVGTLGSRSEAGRCLHDTLESVQMTGYPRGLEKEILHLLQTEHCI